MSKLIKYEFHTTYWGSSEKHNIQLKQHVLSDIPNVFTLKLID